MKQRAANSNTRKAKERKVRQRAAKSSNGKRWKRRQKAVVTRGQRVACRIYIGSATGRALG